MSVEHCCLNCRYWGINILLFEPADEVICNRGHGHTSPYDHCNEFSKEYEEEDDNLGEREYVEMDKLLKMSIFTSSGY